MKSGMLTRINRFLHGLVYRPRDDEDDPFTFVDDIAWMQESERLRRDALTFWDATAMNRHYKQRTDFSAAGKFIRKHAPGLSELDNIDLESLIGKDSDQPQALAAEPVRKTADAWDDRILVMAGTATDGKMTGPVNAPSTSPNPLSVSDGHGCVTITHEKVIPYSEHYAVYLKLTKGTRPR